MFDQCIEISAVRQPPAAIFKTDGRGDETPDADGRKIHRAAFVGFIQELERNMQAG